MNNDLQIPVVSRTRYCYYLPHDARIHMQCAPGSYCTPGTVAGALTERSWPPPDDGVYDFAGDCVISSFCMTHEECVDPATPYCEPRFPEAPEYGTCIPEP
ncbi:hypothetical protein KKF84_11835 [Myxococcota bacterium]|nr:hypothetical protein [Myxococcota bacterium]